MWREDLVFFPGRNFLILTVLLMLGTIYTSFTTGRSFNSFLHFEGLFLYKRPCTGVLLKFYHISKSNTHSHHPPPPTSFAISLISNCISFCVRLNIFLRTMYVFPFHLFSSLPVYTINGGIRISPDMCSLNIHLSFIFICMNSTRFFCYFAAQKGN